jgi:hypothetical protein
MAVLFLEEILKSMIVLTDCVCTTVVLKMGSRNTSLIPCFICHVFSGPEGTSFEDGVFVAQLVFPTDYPMSPPKMKFISEIFHPNGQLLCLVSCKCISGLLN